MKKMKTPEYFPMGWIIDTQNQALHTVSWSLSLASLYFNWSNQFNIWEPNFYKNKVFKLEENTAYCFYKTSELGGFFNTSGKVNHRLRI